jgi:hypothetical protein
MNDIFFFIKLPKTQIFFMQILNIWASLMWVLMLEAMKRSFIDVLRFIG